jgi:hypothetical protein
LKKLEGLDSVGKELTGMKFSFTVNCCLYDSWRGVVFIDGVVDKPRPCQAFVPDDRQSSVFINVSFVGFVHFIEPIGLLQIVGNKASKTLENGPTFSTKSVSSARSHVFSIQAACP